MEVETTVLKQQQQNHYQEKKKTLPEWENVFAKNA